MSIRLVAAIALIALVPCLAACGSGSSNDDPDPETGTVTGIVETESVAVTSSQAAFFPVEGATVVFTGTPGTFETMTDGAGMYSIMLPAGTYSLHVYKGTVEFDDFMASGIVVAAAGEVTENATLVPAAMYVGSEACITCHGDIYDEFVQSGHPYKLNKVGATAPDYPFTSLQNIFEPVTRIQDDGQNIPDGLADPNGLETDNLANGTPEGWSDVSYVIGGFFWKARFIDDDGHIVTGTSVQYNFATDAMVSYHNNETAKVYNCGNCHTTGWRHYDADDNDARQDGLTGMDGTFAAPGVHCEACHGAGSRHVDSGDPADITLMAMPRTAADWAHGRMGYGMPVACGECHTRDGEHDYPSFESAYNVARAALGLDPVPMGGRIAASGGLIKHHEQYDEILGVDPATLESTRSVAFMNTHGDCMTCHSMDNDGLGGPHSSTVYMGHMDYDGADGVQSGNSACMVCHASYDPMLRQGGMKGLDCVDCHMPKLAKSAVATTLDNEVVIGDVSSHIFTIDVGTTAQQFTETGSFANPALTVNFACRICHGNDGLFDTNASDTYIFHNNVDD